MNVLGKAWFGSCLLLLASGAPARAQSVLVQVTEEDSGAPISGAFVSLLNQDGQVLRSALSNPAGRFLFPLSRSGTFRIRAEMIGRETGTSLPVTIRGEETASVSLALPIHAIPLAGITVEADEQCRLRPDEASEIFRVWEEARKALTVQAWAEDEGLYRLEISTYVRTLDPQGMMVLGEDRKAAFLEARTPFVSLPPEDLMSGGFIRPLENGGHEYFGPDAPALLSDVFLDTHCFRLRRSRDVPSSIGLAFEPVRAADLPDVQGTLWLDQETAHLQFLEYAYTTSPYGVAEGIAGGRIEFEAMPNGAWIVQRWWIRAPMMELHQRLVRRRDDGLRVAGIQETGGEVMGISIPELGRIAEVERGSVTGTVWDSTLFVPLEGATVYLSGTQYAAVSDALGRYHLEDVPGGTFTAGFTHPRLDTLGVFPGGMEVTVAEGDESELHFGIPASETILLASCRVAEGGAGKGVLTGFVRDRAGGEGLPGARVRLEWQEVLRIDPAAQATDRWLEVFANAEGRYTACGVPLDESVAVSASLLRNTSEVREVGFTREELRNLDLEIELPAGLFSTRTELEGWVEEYGTQGVQGTLVEPGSGDPVRSAEVAVRDPSGRIRVTGVSNERGFFRLQTPVPGRYILSVQALGYALVKEEVLEVPEGRLAVLEVTMAPEALELEPLVVVAEARRFHLEMEGFYERQTRGAGGGLFITPEKLEQRNPRKLTDVFFGLLGTTVMEPTLGAGGRAVFFPRSGLRFSGQICWPMIYVDHHLASTGGLAGADPTALDTYVHGTDVAAVEVYRSAAEVPAEFSGANAGCGVIVVWTKRGSGG